MGESILILSLAIGIKVAVYLYNRYMIAKRRMIEEELGDQNNPIGFTIENNERHGRGKRTYLDVFVRENGGYSLTNCLIIDKTAYTAEQIENIKLILGSEDMVATMKPEEYRNMNNVEDLFDE